MSPPSNGQRGLSLGFETEVVKRISGVCVITKPGMSRFYCCWVNLVNCVFFVVAIISLVVGNYSNTQVNYLKGRFL